jgi:hypothetical protein
MGDNRNGVHAGNGTANGAKAPAVTKTVRAPRRLVLLEGDETSAVREVLAEYEGAEVSGQRLHADVQRLAQLHRGRHVAAEWLGPLGWTRFLWCRK